MPTCPICSDNVSSLPQHTTDCHTTPADMVISGVLTKFVRDGDDDAIVVPSATAPIDTGGDLTSCVTSKTTTISTLRHPILMASDLLAPVWRTCQKVLGRRPSSLSTKSARSLKVIFFQISRWCCELTWLPSFEAKPRIMKPLRVTSSAIPSSPVLSQFPSYLALPCWGASCGP